MNKYLKWILIIAGIYIAYNYFFKKRTEEQIRKNTDYADPQAVE